MSVHRDVVLVSGKDFKPNSTVRFVVHSVPTPAGSAGVDGTGSFRVGVQLPATLQSGLHRIEVLGISSGGNDIALSQPITIASSTLSGTSGPPVDSLALTGAGADVITTSALVLAGLGVALRRLSRQRKSQP